MTYRKKLIEIALPLEAINVASAREKSIRHGHPSTLHLWWARRPLAACRAVIFASLVDDPNDPDAPAEFVEACRKLPRGKNAAENDTPRQRLFDFIETLVQWESTTDEQVLDTARRLIRLATNDNPPPLLDPFAGGGSIPLEAQRLGLEAHASDLNPVAVMINKALIEIPPRFADRPPVNPRDREKMGSSTGWKGAAGLAADVRYYGEWMRDRAREQIGHLYPEHEGKTVIAWLWARTVKCPNPVCGVAMPLVSSFWLSKKKGQYAWLEPVLNKVDKTIGFEIRTGQPTGLQANRNDTGTAAVNDKGKKVRATFRCLFCGQGIAKGDYIDCEANEGRMGVLPLAIVVDGASGREYLHCDENQIQVALQDAPIYLMQIDPEGNLVPDEPARGTFASNAQGRVYGFRSFGNYFTARQLVALLTLTDLLHEVQNQIRQDAVRAGLNEDGLELRHNGADALAYAQAVKTYLAMAISRLSDIQNALCRWENTKTQVRNLFTRQAVPMLWDFAENNLFAGAAGDFSVTLGSMLKVIERFVPGVEGTAIQQDVQKLEGPSSILVSTDPPYYDNISYADLSDFFYIWLRRGIRDVYPDVFSTLLVPKSTELVVERYRFDGDGGEATRHFEKGLYDAFCNMRDAMHPGFPLTSYYAFKQEEIAVSQDSAAFSNTGWEIMLESLMRAGFSINGTWPMRTELSNRPVASLRNALASSVVLVCRLRSTDAPIASRREFVNALRQELPAALREMQTGNIAPVDLTQATIGPGMAVYSRYSRVLEPNGDRLTVRTALQLINHELDAYLAEQEGHIDEDSRFAVAWFEQFGFREGPFGQADVLARAKNTSVDGLSHAGVLRSGAGKVQLYHWSELDPGWDPTTDRRLTVWESVHHLVERLNVHGEEGAAMLLAKMPSDLAAQARQLAYRLYSICERKGWAEHARDYNALVISWSASQEQAREFREQVQQGTLPGMS